MQNNSFDVRGSTILVVDDTKLNIDILVDTLKDDYTLSVATSGKRALSRALQSPPDLVLLDIMMPGMDGFEVCKRLKADKRTRDVPVVFITALSESQAVVEGFECGAVDYISKPIDPAEVRARVKTHLSLLHARKTLELKSAQLERSNQRLQELDDIKSSFLSSVAHELRTPLTSILGFAKLISKEFQKSFEPLVPQDDKGLRKKAERIHDNLTVVSQEGGRLSRMINDVLDLTKIESGRIDWRDEPFSLEPVIRLATQAVQGLFSENPDLELRLELPSDEAFLTAQVRADRDRIQQVLINLLHNAAKFTSEGHVAVSAQLQEDERVRIDVADTGMGIPAEDIDRIFNKFHQVVAKSDTLPQDKPKGTGLGLPICKQIIEHYGGRIWAESAPGTGSTLSFELPLHSA